MLPTKIALQDIDQDEQYDVMIESIEQVYRKNKPFHLLLETRQVRNIKMRYLYKFGAYMNTLKKRHPQNLMLTTIHVYDDLIYNLLYTLFTFLCSPVAKVVVIYYHGGYDSDDTSIKKVKEYYPTR